MSHTTAVIVAFVAARARHIRELRGWRRSAVAFGAGALSVLAMAPFFVAPVLFVTLPVFIWLIDGSLSGDASVRRDGEDVTKRSIICARTAHGLKRAAVAGWWFGFGYFLFGMFWIGEAFLVEAEKFAWLLPAAVMLLPAGLALFFAAAGALTVLLWRPGFGRVVALATALGLTEWLRGHILTGLPWNTLGYALTWPETLMQSAGLVGIYCLTILAVFVFASPLVRVTDWAEQTTDTFPGASGSVRATSFLTPLSGMGVAAFVLVGLWTYGSVRLAGDTGARVPGVNLRIVQPSIRQRDKWQPDKQREIFDLHVALSRTNAAGVRDDLSGITHVIWPEAAMPFLPLDTPQALAEIGEMLPDGVLLISGALRVDWPNEALRTGEVPRSTNTAPSASSDATTKAGDPSHGGASDRPRQRRAYNSLMVFGSEGGLTALYDKIHLVPFGEYLPFQDALESIGLEQLTRLRGGFATGRTPRPLLDIPGLPPLLGLVCYEAIFPGEIVQGQERPGLIVNVTNDGWFGNTTGPRQHFHMARVRAAEQGVSVVRVANNGISAVIDPYGRAIARLELDQRGVADSALPAAVGRPPYGWWGDWLTMLYFLVSVVWLVGRSAVMGQS